VIISFRFCIGSCWVDKNMNCKYLLTLKSTGFSLNIVGGSSLNIVDCIYVIVLLEFWIAILICNFEKSRGWEICLLKKNFPSLILILPNVVTLQCFFFIFHNIFIYLKCWRTICTNNSFTKWNFDWAPVYF